MFNNVDTAYHRVMIQGDKLDDTSPKCVVSMLILRYRENHLHYPTKGFVTTIIPEIVASMVPFQVIFIGQKSFS